MRLGDILNQERVNALNVDMNAYGTTFNNKSKRDNATTQYAEKVVFQEPYENAEHYYNKNNFNPPSTPELPPNNSNKNFNNQVNFPMFNIGSILPMLMSGKFNDVIKPLMSILGGGKGGSGGMDFAKIFELFKPKSKTKTEEKKEEEISSKFDDFIIIED